METITQADFRRFVGVVKRSRANFNSAPISDYDLAHYCQTLINGASAFTILACMGCSDRLDLVDGSEDGSNPCADALEAKFKAFSEKYLGLRLITAGDPRGAVFKLVVPDGMGDSFGDRSHLCVPANDAYFCA